MALVYCPRLRRYVEVASPLTVYTFKVTDSQTGAPIQGAACTVTDRPETIRAKEGAGGYTDINGVCIVEALFAAHYYTVGKAGYVTKWGTIPGSQINVALDPTTLLYWVTINAGSGGAVNPSGAYQVAANTRITVTATSQTGYTLDYWLVNGVKGGAVNPITVTVDRDSYSVYAVFKTSDAPPPPPDGNGAEWPYSIQVHIFDKYPLKSGWFDTWKDVTRTLEGVDMSFLLGGKVAYRITYTQGNAGFARLISLHLNDTNLIPTGEAATLQPGQSMEATVDVTGLIRGANTVKIGYETWFGKWAELTFDVMMTLGYSEKPVINPSTDKSWLEWVKNNSTPLIIGGVVVTGAYVLTRKGIPQFVVQMPQVQYRKREEE